MRLIDADKAVNEIAELIEQEWGYEGIEEDVKRIFDGQPTVDAVEVVLCRECLRERYCKFTQYQGMNGYCSLGERICNECVECDCYWANNDTGECQGQAKPCHEFRPKRGD